MADEVRIEVGPEDVPKALAVIAEALRWRRQAARETLAGQRVAPFMRLVTAEIVQQVSTELDQAGELISDLLRCYAEQDDDEEGGAT